MQKLLVAFMLRSPGPFHMDICAATREILYFNSCKSLTEGNLHNNPRNWGLAQVGKLAHRCLTRVTGGNQKQNWDWDFCTAASREVVVMFSAGFLLPQCMHTIYPLPHAMETCHHASGGLRCSFGIYDDTWYIL